MRTGTSEHLPVTLTTFLPCFQVGLPEQTPIREINNRIGEKLCLRLGPTTMMYEDEANQGQHEQKEMRKGSYDKTPKVKDGDRTSYLSL